MSEKEKFTFLSPKRRSAGVHAEGVNDVWPGEIFLDGVVEVSGLLTGVFHDCPFVYGFSIAGET